MLPAMAFSKIAGLEVMPRKPSSSNQAREFAGRDQAAADVVEPNRLAKSAQCFQRILRSLLFFRLDWFRGQTHAGTPSCFLKISRTHLLGTQWVEGVALSKQFSQKRTYSGPLRLWPPGARLPGAES